MHPPRLPLPSGLSARIPNLPTRLPTWQDIGGDATTLRRILNVWPPYRFAGIRVDDIAPDFSRAVVRLRLTPLTRNYFGTQFGGSMASMSDPFWVLLVTNRLGPDYVVWDRRAEIDFVAPGRTDVTTAFEVSGEFVDELRAAAEGGQKVLRWVENDIVDVDGELIARVRRQLYVRHKDHARPQ